VATQLVWFKHTGMSKAMRASLLTGGGLALAGAILLATGNTDAGILCIALCGVPSAGYACLRSLRPVPPAPDPVPVVVVLDEDPRPVSQNDVLS
jgi:hypothetical protein